MTSTPGMGLVIIMGLGTVFIGLICIIVICYIMGAVIRAFEKNKLQTEAPQRTDTKPAQSEHPAASSALIENKGELIAAISAVIAEELGEDVEAIRIKSIKRV